MLPHCGSSLPLPFLPCFYNVVKALFGIRTASTSPSLPIETIRTVATANNVLTLFVLLQSHPAQGAAPAGGVTFYNPAQFAQVWL